MRTISLLAACAALSLAGCVSDGSTRIPSITWDNGDKTEFGKVTATLDEGGTDGLICLYQRDTFDGVSLPPRKVQCAAMESTAGKMLRALATLPSSAMTGFFAEFVHKPNTTDVSIMGASQ